MVARNKHTWVRMQTKEGSRRQIFNDGLIRMDFKCASTCDESVTANNFSTPM